MPYPALERPGDISLKEKSPDEYNILLYYLPREKGDIRADELYVTKNPYFRY